jgi:NAD(P)-dependent dehydrogenase (short-subunit alcohol dehydrogenase family)
MAHIYCLLFYFIASCLTLISQVTGAGRGVGRRVALNFGRRQAFVVCWDKDAENNQNTVSIPIPRISVLSQSPLLKARVAFMGEPQTLSKATLVLSYLGLKQCFRNTEGHLDVEMNN